MYKWKCLFVDLYTCEFMSAQFTPLLMELLLKDKNKDKFIGPQEL